MESEAVQTYLFITKDESEPSQIELGDNVWSCSKTTLAGNVALVYVTKIGVSYEWRVLSDAEPDEDLRFACKVEFIRKFEPPITIGELKAEFSQSDWPKLYTNFWGDKSVILDADIAGRIRALRSDSFLTRRHTPVIQNNEITHRCEVKISRFYEEALGVPLTNPRWSWGAIDPKTNRVFLNVWSDRVSTDVDGEKIHVLWKEKEKSSGYPERVRHLEAIQRGATGIGILCQNVQKKGSASRKIDFFDDEQLILLGEFSEDDDSKYAHIIKRLPVSELSDCALLADIRSIIANENIDSTTAQALVNARLGQGKFGLAVRKLWNHQCAATGSCTKEALEASHIQPWAHSDDTQRLDPDNGILLAASVHRLFDAGLITFDASGRLLTSSKLSRLEQKLFGVAGKKLSRKPSIRTAKYLSYHCANIFLG